MKKTLINNTSNKTKRANMKKALLSLSIIGLGLASVTTVQAQQTPLSNFYNFNEYLINPAQAGYRNQLEGSASHRIQWQGIEGAPTTTFLGVHGALNDNMGLGVKLNLDQTDILQQFNAAVSYAYRIKLNEGSSLSFGISGMALQNSINYGDAVIGDYADDVINGGDQSGMTFDAEFGILYELKKFKFGVASSHLFESGVDYDIPENGGTGTFERVRQFTAYSSYQFDLNESWTLEPFALVRNQGPGSFQFELNALTAYNEMLYLGAGYRQEAGYIGRVGFQITDQLMAAYAYEFGNTGVASYSGGSHEFMLGYNLGKMHKKEPEVKEELAPEPTAKRVEEKVIPTTESEDDVELINGVFQYNNLPQANAALVILNEEGYAIDTIYTNDQGTFSYNKLTADQNYSIVPLNINELDELRIDLNSTNTNGDKKVHYVSKVDFGPVTNKEDKYSKEEEVKEVGKLNPEVFEKDIKFDFESSNKESSTIESNPALDKIAAYLVANPNKRIRLEGHTCNMGSDEVNRRYSLQRANTVKDYFMNKGVKGNQMEVKAMLDSEPLVPNTSIKNRQQNRRVELEMIN